MKQSAEEVLRTTGNLGRAWLLTNIVSLGSGAALAKVAAFLGTAYLARVLGPEGFGIIGFATALCGYFGVGVQGGFPDTGIREVSHRPAGAVDIAAGAIVVRVAVALVGMALLAGVAILLPESPTVKLVTVLSSLSFLTIALDTSWVYMGLARNRSVGLAFVIGQLGYVIILLLLVHGQGDVARVPVAQFLGELGGALFLLVPLFRRSGFRVDLAAGFSLVRGTGSLTVMRFLRTFVFTLDVVMIKYYMSEGPVGLYSSGYRICYMVMVVVGSVHAAYLPGLAQALGRGALAVTSIAQRSVDLTFIIAAPIVVGGALLATGVLTTAFGADYAGGAGAFRLLLVSIALILISMTVHDVILVHERTRAEVWVVGSAAILNAALNVVLIPRYGLIGAAGATVLSELLILVGGLVILNGLGVRLSPWSALRPLGAAGLMAATLVLLGTGRSIFLLVPIGALVYLAGLASLGAMPRDAWPMLEGLLRPGAKRAG